MAIRERSNTVSSRRLQLGAISVLLLGGCKWEEHTTVTGYEGLARINPYLAAERLLDHYGFTTESKPGWPVLDRDLSMVVVPASVLEVQGYVSQIETWMQGGGHLVICLEGGESYLNDHRDLFRWGSADVPAPVEDLLGRYAIEFREKDAEESDSDVDGEIDEDKLKTEVVSIGADEFIARNRGRQVVSTRGDESSVIASQRADDGRLTVLADARILRNRYIGDDQHADILVALAELSPGGKLVSFVRGAGLSFWTLLWKEGWAIVTALIVTVIFWLWKNLPRFGPLDSRDRAADSLDYQHHVRALGDYFWRLDQARGLMEPLRNELLDKVRRRYSTNQSDEVCALLAVRAEISEERVQRALGMLKPYSDKHSLAQQVADLQRLHQSVS